MKEDFSKGVGLIGKTVGAIGTGIKGIQKIGELAIKLSKHLYRFLKLAFIALKAILMFIIALGPIGLIIILILIGIFAYIGWYTWGPGILKEQEEDLIPNAIFFTQEDLEILGIPLDEKGNIEACKNIDINNKENIFSSEFENMIEIGYESEKEILKNLCFYHIIYQEKINGKLESSKIDLEIEEAREKERKNNEIEITHEDGTTSIINGKDYVEKLKTRKEVVAKVNSKFNFNVKNKLFIKYEDWDNFKIVNGEPEAYNYGYYGHYNFPTKTFDKKEDFIFLMYFYYLGAVYGQNFGEELKTTLGGTASGTIDQMNWNNESELFLDYLNGHDDLLNYMDEIVDETEFYEYTCKPCKKEDKSQCVGCYYPEKELKRRFTEKDAKKIFLNYKNFIVNAIDDNIIYTTALIMPPFKNYTNAKGEKCKINLTITQFDTGTDGHRFMKYYSFAKGVHNGLDMQGTQSCGGRGFTRMGVPIYNMVDGTVILKMNNNKSYGNLIRVKSI
ncbi:MAG: hypothetical protein Q9M94_04880, partial [Candidatus Gracilibacteria bacterium]|nr:hypothetical protein [Candidatus Gracilibacteria bacterium]